MARRGFGSVRKLPSKRFQAHYTGPDLQRHTAPQTFETKADAEGWLADRRREIVNDEWQPPAAAAPPITLGEYAERFIMARDISPRTRSGYRRTLDKYILPTFQKVPIKSVGPEAIDAWYYRLDPNTPTERASAYGLMRTLLNEALQKRLIQYNPCVIRGAGNVKRAGKTEIATLEQLETITAAMPERHQLAVQFAAWCALRFGEITELRRKDVDVEHRRVKVRRSVGRVDPKDLEANGLPPRYRECGCRPGCVIGPPKTDAGERDVAIPKELMPLVRRHLLEHAAPGADGLLFPGRGGAAQHLAPAALYGEVDGTKKWRDRRTGAVMERHKVGWGWYHARAQAGRPDLRFHDLRHTGATYAAQAGATIAELMSRLGHTTPGAAMRYQHAASTRDQEIADRLFAVAGGSRSA